MAGGLSLKARAVGLLSRREHSRREMARKLSAHSEDAAAVEKVLDDLVREGWLSDDRFAQSLVHRRARTHGAARIASELRQGGIADDTIAAFKDELRETEFDRAREVWCKKFASQPAEDPRAFAKQARFLAGRGFSADVIYRVLGASPDAFED